MGNILSFLFPKPAPAALEAQELGQAPAAPAKEAVEEHPPTAPARSKKTVEAPTAQKIEEAPVVENIGSVEDASVAESTIEPTPEPVKEPTLEPVKEPEDVILEKLKGPTPEPIRDLTPELIKEFTPETVHSGSFCGVRDAVKEPTPEPVKEPVEDVILEPVRLPTPEPIEPIREPTPEPIRELLPEPVHTGSFCGVRDDPPLKAYTAVKEPTPEPVREPTPEPVIDAAKVLTPELIKELAPELIIEPTPEPVKEVETPSIAEVVAEAVVSTAAVTEEIIDDDKPASIDGAAELRDFLEKPKVEEVVATPEPLKEPSLEPQSVPGTASVIAETVEKIATVSDEVIDDVKEPVSKSPEPQSGIANIVAETVEKIASVSEEVIDDVKPATIDGAAELRDFLEKPKESSPEPETTPSIASVIAEAVGKASTITEEVIDEDEAYEESVKSPVSEAIVETVDDLASVVVPEAHDIIKPTTPEISSTKSQEEVEVIGSIQEDTTLDDNLKKSEVKGAALLKDILDD